MKAAVRTDRDASAHVYPQARLILLDAGVVYLTWAAIALCAVTAFAGLFLPSLYGGTLPVLIGCCLALGTLHVALALMHRCPHCRKHPTVQGFAPVHPAAEPGNGRADWVGVVVSVVRRRRFTCLHCGTPFDVK